MKQLLLCAVLLATTSATLAAQERAPAPATQPAQAKPAPRPVAPSPAERAPAQTPPGSKPVAAEPVPYDAPNLRYEIAIADEGGGAPATRKNVSVIARATNQTASVRSQGQLNAEHPLSIAAKAHGIGIGLSVDVRGVVQNGRIPSRVTVEYQPFWPDAKSLPSSVRVQIDVVLDEGRRTLIAQAADPLTDRRTIIEVTATIIK